MKSVKPRFFRPGLLAGRCLTLAALWLGSLNSPASVTVEFSNPGGTIEVAPGGSFQLTLSLVTTGEEVMGLDYRMEISGAASGYLTLTARDYTGSAFSDPVETNAMVLAPAAAVMDPQNSLSLGSWTADFTAVGTGTWEVATFTILVAANAPAGAYTLQTISPAGAGWFDQNFEDHDFDEPASLTVSIVPEPSAIALSVLGLLTVILGPRKRRLCGSVAAACVLLTLLSPASAQTWPDYEYRQFNNTMNYRLCKPQNFDPSGATKYPLVIYWHGNGDTDTVSPFVVGDPTQCNAKQMTDCGQFEFMSEANQAIFPCFLVLPQRKTAAGVDTNTPALAAALVDALAGEFPIDVERVIVTGLSGGGGRTLACAVANPAKYAAIVPLSTIISGGSAAQVAAAIQNIPTWFFHSANDSIVGITGTSDTLVRELRKIGARPIYTRYALGDHTPAMWKHSYKTPPLIPWIATQRRGQAQQDDPARVVILAPSPALSHSSTSSSVTLSGVVDTRLAGTLLGPLITKVEWAKGDYHISSNHSPATGTTSWTANSAAALNASGQTVLEAVAIGTSWAPDYLGATYYSATLLATYAPTGDPTAPTVTITSPTRKQAWKTKAAFVNLAGTAHDAVGGVARVEWRNNRGGSGAAAGTSQWEAAGIPLESGENILTIRALDSSGNTGSDTLTVTNTRPSDTPTSLWSGTNIGEGATPGVFPGVPGSFFEEAGTLTIRGSGSTMWGVDNQYYFVHQPVSGDFQFIARIKSQQASGQGSAGGTNLAGIMIADTLTRNARYALVGCSGGDRASFRGHYGPNDTWGGSAHNAAFRPPCWLRLTRNGTTFVCDVSNDGTAWTAIAPNENIGIPTSAHIGFGVTSADNSVLSTAVFDNISLTRGTAPVLISAASRMVHGPAGNLDLDLPLSGATGVEPRFAATPGSYEIRFTFDRPVASASASLQTGAGLVGGTTATGNVITVSLNTVPDGQTLSLSLQNVVPQNGGLAGNAALSFAVLIGDANASKSVTTADAALVKSSAGQPVTAETLPCDIDANGTIDGADFSLVRTKLGATAP